MSRTLIGVVVVTSAMLAVAVPQAQDAASMNKPIQKFTIGDLFPKVAHGLRETSTAWKAAAEDRKSVV